MQYIYIYVVYIYIYYISTLFYTLLDTEPHFSSRPSLRTLPFNLLQSMTQVLIQEYFFLFCLKLECDSDGPSGSFSKLIGSVRLTSQRGDALT
jgi:hypothetical protein